MAWIRLDERMREHPALQDRNRFCYYLDLCLEAARGRGELSCWKADPRRFGPAHGYTVPLAVRIDAELEEVGLVVRDASTLRLRLADDACAFGQRIASDARAMRRRSSAIRNHKGNPDLSADSPLTVRGQSAPHDHDHDHDISLPTVERESSGAAVGRARHAYAGDTPAAEARRPSQEPSTPSQTDTQPQQALPGCDVSTSEPDPTVAPSVVAFQRFWEEAARFSLTVAFRWPVAAKARAERAKAIRTAVEHTPDWKDVLCWAWSNAIVAGRSTSERFSTAPWNCDRVLKHWDAFAERSKFHVEASTYESVCRRMGREPLFEVAP